VTADSIPDVFYIPFERDGTTEVSGVFLHALLASQMIRYAFGEGSPIRVLGDGTEALAIVACGLIGALLGLWSSSAWRFGLAGAIAVPGLWGLGLVAMQQGFWIPIVPAGAAWVLSGAVVTAYLAGRVRAERSELMQLFSRHVSAEVAEDVWNRRDEFMAGGRPQPTRLTATVLFVDMKGYTGKADQLDPSDLMLWLNDYLDLLSQDILSAGGLVDDYFGDGIMAAFGLPVPRTGDDEIRADAVSAVSCALSMEESVRRVNKTWGPKGYPTIGIRVGLCTGVIVAGTIGSAERLKYSIVGDVVVTAQRLESLDDSQHDFEQEPIRILISQETREHVAHAFDTREQGEAVLKGRVEPVMIYRVMGTLGEKTVNSSDTEGPQ
jgi:adenylate cyclase